MTNFLLIWYVIGLVSTLWSIKIFRPNGTDKVSELMLAVFGPFFGPIITILMVLDWSRSKTTKGKQQ